MEDKILEQIQKVFDEKNIIVKPDSIIADIADSLIFIKTVIALEKEFEFEFDIEMMLVKSFSEIKSLIEYVKSKAGC